MTFSEIVSDVMDRLGHTSSTDETRIGRAVNRFYKEITSSLGIKHVSRRTTTQATTTQGVSTLTFTSVEKVVDVYNRNVSPYKKLTEVTVDELRAQMPYNASDTPTEWALITQASDYAVIELNCTPQTEFALYADVYSTTPTLSGSDEPVFPESYHNLLIDGPLIDEYLKNEKPLLSAKSEQRYEKRLAELRLSIAVSTSKKIVQGKTAENNPFGALAAGGSGGGGGFNGALSWTQTGLVTFDRDPSAPFAVTASSAVVPNLDADKLDGHEATAFAQIDGTANAGHLLFVDNTYDIGASGATRPRDFFLARNAVAGGTLGVTGNTTLGGTLSLTGAATLSSTLTVTGASTFNGQVGLGAAMGITWTGRSTITSPSDGVVVLWNNAASGFSRLNFGGNSSSFPGLRRTGTGLDVVLADASAYSNITASSFVAAVDLQVAPAGPIYLDGGGGSAHTYIQEALNDDLRFVVGGTLGLQLVPTSANFQAGLTCSGVMHVAVSTALPAGGSTSVRMLLSTSTLGVYAGSGAPTVSASKGSLYLRSDGSSTSTRAYINTDGGTTWTAITTAA